MIGGDEARDRQGGPLGRTAWGVDPGSASALGSLQLLEGVVGNVDPDLVTEAGERLQHDLDMLVGALARLELRVKVRVLVFDGEDHGVMADRSERKVCHAGRHQEVNKEGKAVPAEEGPAGKELRFEKNPHLVNLVMNAFVNKKGEQLTRKNPEITAFYYYETRGSRNEVGSQDSGLLEVPPIAGLPTPYGAPVSTPRSIYGIYKAKVPLGH